MRTYSGNPKGDAIQQFISHDERWELAVLGVKGSWVNLKLYALSKVPNKGNYWLTARSKARLEKGERRIICSPRFNDSARLARHRKNLFQQVQTFLEEYYK